MPEVPAPLLKQALVPPEAPVYVVETLAVVAVQPVEVALLLLHPTGNDVVVPKFSEYNVTCPQPITENIKPKTSNLIFIYKNLKLISSSFSMT